MPLKIGKAEIKTPYLLAGGAVAVILVGYGIIKKKQATAAAAAAAPSTAVDPQTGDIAGSPQDQADLAALQGGGADLGYGGYGAYDTGLGGYGAAYPNTGGFTGSGPGAIDPNSGIPYAEEAGWVYNDQSGTWSYQGTGSGNAGAGAVTTNSEWLQACEAYFVNNGLVADGGQALVAALGKYLAGSPVTPDQETLIEEAKGVEGYPPVSGPGGYPPGVHLASTQTTPPPAGGGNPPNTGGTPPPPGESRPGMPTGVKGSAASPTTIRLSWTAVPGATSYRAHATYQGGDTATVTTAGTSATLTGLTPNHTYTCHVAAVNSAGESAATNGPAVKTPK